MRRRLPLSALVSALTIVSTFFVFSPPASANFEVPTGRIAYVTTVNGHRTIFVIDAANPSDKRSLVDLGDRDASQPAWTFDGTQMAFTAQTSPGGPTAIFVANADGSGIEQVTFPGSGESDSDASWSPTGEEIVFARTLATGVSRILIASVNTRDLRGLDYPSLPSATEPDWSSEGSRIAFVAKQFVDPSVCDSDPATCTWNLFVASADGTGQPRALGQLGFNYHNPDWSPDGRSLAFQFGLRNDPTFALVEVMTPIPNANILNTLDGTGVYEPSWSPYGREQLVARFGRTGPVVLLIYDWIHQTNFLTLGAEPAWGAIPGIPPIPPIPFETSPPTIQFSTVTNDQGWLTDPHVEVAADDQTSVNLICTLDGQFTPVHLVSLAPPELRGSVALFGVSEGEHALRCRAFDTWNNQSSTSITVKVDFTPPILGPISFSPRIMRVDQTTTVTIPFVEHGSGLDSATVQLGPGADGPSFPMSASDSTLTGTIGASVPAGIWGLSASAVDNNGNWSSRNYFFDFLVVYDTAAGSVNGTGWIVPGGSTSEIYDYLPGGLDGRTKASFSFKVQYKDATSTTPTGAFSVSYGNQFKLQSEGFDWLVVRPSMAEFQGTATIKGLPGTFTFQAIVQDGASTGSMDRLELRLWPTGADPFRDSPQFQATGDAGGQIQIRT